MLLILSIVVSFACTMLYPETNSSNPTETENVSMQDLPEQPTEYGIEGVNFLGIENLQLLNEASVQDKNGNLYFLGTTKINSNQGDGFYYNLLLIKADLTESNVIWETQISANAGHLIASIAVDSHGSLYVSSTSDKTWGNPINSFTPDEKYGRDIFITKIDEQGTVLWNTFIGASQVSNIISDTNDNIFVLLKHDGGNYSQTVLAKINSDGLLLKDEYITLDCSSASSSGCYEGEFAFDQNGNIYLSGDGQDHNMFIAKYTQNGELLWNNSVGGSETLEYGPPYDIVFDKNNEVLLLGESDGNWGNPINPYDGGYVYDDPSYDMNGRESFIVKINSNGAVLWQTFLNKNIYVMDLFSDQSDNIYLIGNSYDTWGNPLLGYSGEGDGFIASLNSGGAFSWNAFIGGNGNDVIYYAILTDGQIFYIVGSANTEFGNPTNHINLNGDNTRDVFVVKIKLP